MRVVIPCKPFAFGKSRLAGALSETARRDLCVRLLHHALSIAKELVVAADVLVVTSDPDAVAIAERQGASALLDTRRGLNIALSVARDSLRGAGEGMLVLPIDLIEAEADDIRPALEAKADVLIAPDRARQGTNLLYLSPVALPKFRFAFGHDSFAVHRRIAQEEGISVAILDNPALAFDLDLPQDYEAWRRNAKS